MCDYLLPHSGFGSCRRSCWVYMARNPGSGRIWFSGWTLEILLIFQGLPSWTFRVSNWLCWPKRPCGSALPCPRWLEGGLVESAEKTRWWFAGELVLNWIISIVIDEYEWILYYRTVLEIDVDTHMHMNHRSFYSSSFYKRTYLHT